LMRNAVVGSFAMTLALRGLQSSNAISPTH
jgi:hypothetical protein